jgi:ribosomal protein S18 acetylase RimI-like enzyme
MIIRNAKPEDKLTAASLIMEAIDDLAKIFTGFDNEESIKKEMENLFSENNNRFSHEYCTVIEINGEVAASVITYPASLMKELNETVIKKLKKRFVNDEKSFLYYSEKIRNSREAFDDEYYIDNLAVSTEFRGKGLSKILITAAEKKGIEEGYKKISIIAEIHNEKAFDIYKHLGYIKDCEIEVLGHRYHHLVKE